MNGLYLSSDETWGSRHTLNTPTVYYRKSTAWSYEREWRLIRPLAEASRMLDHPVFPRALHAIPLSALTGIIIGVAVPHSQRVGLFNLIARPEFQHIKIFQTRLSDTSYELEMHPPLDGVYPPDALRGRICEAR